MAFVPQELPVCPCLGADIGEESVPVGTEVLEDDQRPTLGDELSNAFGVIPCIGFIRCDDERDRLVSRELRVLGGVSQQIALDGRIVCSVLPELGRPVQDGL